MVCSLFSVGGISKRNTIYRVRSHAAGLSFFLSFLFLCVQFIMHWRDTHLNYYLVKGSGDQRCPELPPFILPEIEPCQGGEGFERSRFFFEGHYKITPCQINCSNAVSGKLQFRFGLLMGFNASATARVISRRWNDDGIRFLVEETGVPGGNHRPVQSVSTSQ